MNLFNFFNICVGIGLVGGYIYGAFYWTPWFGALSGGVIGFFAGALLQPSKKTTDKEEK